MTDETLSEQRAARARFLNLVEGVRSDLHRYAARMTGSVSDGEDVVQDTLARAYFLLPELSAVPELRPWLFRVAHHRAIDVLRRHDRRTRDPVGVDEHTEKLEEEAVAADDAVARKEAIAAALTRFLELRPIPRSCVVLKDVLDHSLAEIASLLELSLPAVKAALRRGRVKLAAARERPVQRPDPSPVVARYVALFNARDWDALRELLADDVRLEVDGRIRRRGRQEVGGYFGNYARADGWHLRVAWHGGREVVAVHSDAGAGEPGYFIGLGVDDERVLWIRDFRYVPYILVDAALD